MPRKPNLSVVKATGGISSDEEQHIRDYVQNADNDTLACRQKHDLPPLELLKNGKLPRNLRARRERDGSWQVKQYCKRSCGYYRILTTMPGGILNPADVQYESRYEDPTYLARGFRVPPRYAVAEMWRRMLEDLEAHPDVVDDSNRGIPGVKFQGS